jgi:hypothetical protein
MFADPELSELPGLLEARVSPIRQNELLSVLFPVHFRLFTLICTSLQPDAPFHPIDANFRNRVAIPLRLKESFAAQNMLETTNPSNPDIVEAMTAKFMNAIDQTTFLLEGDRFNLPKCVFAEPRIPVVPRLVHRVFCC